MECGKLKESHSYFWVAMHQQGPVPVSSLTCICIAITVIEILPHNNVPKRKRPTGLIPALLNALASCWFILVWTTSCTPALGALFVCVSVCPRS